MIELITFDRIHLLWPIILASVLLWLVFIWKEWKGSLNLRFLVKIIIGGIAITALALIGLQPVRHSKKSTGYTTILSPGYKISQLDSLKDGYKNLTSLTYSPGEDLSGFLKNGREVFLLGEGLQSYDLWQLDNFKVNYLAGERLPGLSQLKYQKESTVGNDFLVKGVYQHGSKGNFLILKGPGNMSLDSIELLGEDIQKFQLSSELIVPGKFVYNLIEKDSTGLELSSDPLPVTISEQNKLKVLIINQFPSFETKYLKNYLARSGHEVVIRSQVSSDRYKYEYFNTEKKGNLRLTGKTVAEYDLLIIDVTSLQKASRSTLNTIQNAVSKEGLGILIQAEETSFTNQVPLLDFNFLRQDSKEVSMEPNMETMISKYPYVFKKDDLHESIQDSEIGLVSAYKRSGSGRIGATVLKNTYELLLDGKTEVYQKIWSVLISKISKRQFVENDLIQQSQLVYQDAPFHFVLKTSLQEPMVTDSEGIHIPLAQDLDFSEYWQGTSFPRDLGWNRLILTNDSTAVLDFYVIDNSKFSALNAGKRMNENKRYFDQNSGKAEPATSKEPIPGWWFFMIFLMGMAFLWLEPKL